MQDTVIECKDKSIWRVRAKNKNPTDAMTSLSKVLLFLYKDKD